MVKCCICLDCCSNTLLGTILLAVNCECVLFAYPVTAPRLEQFCACVYRVGLSDEFCRCRAHCWKKLKTVARRAIIPDAAGGRRASERLGKAPATHGMSWGQDQTSTLVIGVSTANGIAIPTHLPCELGGTGGPRSQLAEPSTKILLLALFST